MPGPNGEQCSRCYFAEMWGDEDMNDPYFCLRYPPSVPPETGHDEAPFPVTVSGDSWCGEFKPKPGSK